MWVDRTRHLSLPVVWTVVICPALRPLLIDPLHTFDVTKGHKVLLTVLAI